MSRITIEMAIEEAFSKLNKEDEFKQPGQDLAVRAVQELLDHHEGLELFNYLVSLSTHVSSGDWMSYDIEIVLVLKLDKSSFNLTFWSASIYETGMWELSAGDWLGDLAMEYLKGQIDDFVEGKDG